MLIAGICIGLALGAIGCLIVNELWYKKADEINRKWSETCHHQSTEWYMKCKELRDQLERQNG